MNKLDSTVFTEKYVKLCEVIGGPQNLVNLYEDFYYIYSDLPIDDATQNNMFNSFTMGAFTVMSPSSNFNTKYTLKPRADGPTASA